MFNPSVQSLSQILDFPTTFHNYHDQHASLFDFSLTSSLGFCRASELCTLDNLDHSVLCWCFFWLLYETSTPYSQDLFLLPVYRLGLISWFSSRRLLKWNLEFSHHKLFHWSFYLGESQHWCCWAISEIPGKIFSLVLPACSHEPFSVIATEAFLWPLAITENVSKMTE